MTGVPLIGRIALSPEARRRLSLRAQLLAGATVGAGARLEGVLVLEGARVAPGAVLAGVVVAP